MDVHSGSSFPVRGSVSSIFGLGNEFRYRPADVASFL